MIDFFKEFLGFKDDDIIQVDRTEFVGKYETDTYNTNFTNATKQRMNEFARPIFSDTKHGLAK